MKKSLLALAALTAFAGAASAQSSVTLFGVVDLSLRNQDNGSAGTMKSLSTDGNASSRLGFRGVEDLGGGMRAGFWIEGAMSPDTGGTGQTWQRRSTLSLLGGFGEIRLGRDYTPTFWNHNVFDPFGTNGVGSQTNLIAGASPIGSGATTTVRANNTVGYFLPAMGGLYGQVQVAAGEGSGGNKYFGGRLGYGAGPVNVAVAYGITEKTGNMIDDYTAMNVGGSYNFGFMTLMGQYHMNEQGSNEQTMMLIAANIPMGAGTFKVSYGTTEVTQGTIKGAEATQLALGYVYDLSKRTAVYAHYSVVDNDAGLRFTTSASGPSVASISGFKSTGFELGVRHSF
ncbi:MAG: porin [Rubrivivax sp.]|jgi:predicted porin